MLATAENVGFGRCLSTSSLGSTSGLLMKVGWQPRRWLKKKAKAGFRGYPAGTIAFYGPDDRRASKVAVGIITAEGAETADLRRWFAESGDVRDDAKAVAEVADFYVTRACVRLR
jgi:hypothetical protein